MRCEEIMCRRVEVIGPGDSIDLAARRMREQRIGFLPVCDGEGLPLGVITDRDIAVRVCAEHLPAAETLVGDVMTGELVCCHRNDTVDSALEVMAHHQKMRLLVLDDANRLAGVISWTDIAQKAEPLRVARLIRDVSAREYRVRGVRP